MEDLLKHIWYDLILRLISVTLIFIGLKFMYVSSVWGYTIMGFVICIVGWAIQFGYYHRRDPMKYKNDDDDENFNLEY